MTNRERDDAVDEYLQEHARRLGAVETGVGNARFESIGQAIGFACRFVKNVRFDGLRVLWGEAK